MDTSVQGSAEHFASHDLNPTGVCPEMLEVAEEACRAGDYELAVEIYSSQLAELNQPDRGLCLRKADALIRADRIAEALDSYCVAANLHRLRPDELKLLVESIAHTVRVKVLNTETRPGGSGAGAAGATGSDLDEPDGDRVLDMFSCRVCSCLLSDPTTLECGHTFCKRCLEDVAECKSCRANINKSWRTTGLRANVILTGLLDKWFEAESKARRCWLEGESLWKKQELQNALEKYNQAVDLVPFISRLIAQRAELLMDMKDFNQAIQDGDRLCRLLTSSPKILSEMFSSIFENDGLVTRLHPLQATGSTPRIKPSSLLSSIHPPTNRDGTRAGCSKDLAPNGDRAGSSNSVSLHNPGSSVSGSKSLAAVLSSLPGVPGGKRKCVGDANTFEPPSKLFKAEQCGSSQTPPGMRTVACSLLDSADMECSLCMRLFYEPVATPCGHTFCLKCLERCLDHNPNCPLCKENLSEYLATRAYKKTFLMEEVLQRYLHEELEERRKVHEEEMKELSNLNQEVPIFVCTMAFPTIPCPLHVFEPRYRLMIRRAMETGTKQFGMCISDEVKGFADYGCMLEVRDVKFFPDGRSVVDTIGMSRFKVLSHGQRDGYNTAKIEYLLDKKVEGEELTELLKMHDSVYDQASAWFSSLKDSMKSQILSHFGHLPAKDPNPQGNPSGPAWCWWLLAVLPLENKAQLTILAMTSLKDRLAAIRRVLVFVTRKRPR
ncbi:LON peptidase N-terminal domain and RING finger protein 2 isoform X2 [Trichomycterus rosablanca]|uniref:LON peptidase N-terminal domain and RING finger protein 2 isoform X2 n=1 Tax=Trichomycterus rosablanca TaxID=2290929 RepID=UPI002F356B51